MVGEIFGLKNETFSRNNFHENVLENRLFIVPCLFEIKNDKHKIKIKKWNLILQVIPRSLGLRYKLFFIRTSMLKFCLNFLQGMETALRRRFHETWVDSSRDEFIPATIEILCWGVLYPFDVPNFSFSFRNLGLGYLVLTKSWFQKYPVQEIYEGLNIGGCPFI